MACVTLKRPLDHCGGGGGLLCGSSPSSPPHGGAHYDPSAQELARSSPAPKRRRFATATPSTIRKEQSRALFDSESSSSSGLLDTPSRKRGHASASSSSCSSSTPSLFRETPLNPGEMANKLRDELKRMKRRRQLVVSGGCNNSPPTSPRSDPMDDVTAMRTAEAALGIASSAAATSSSSGLRSESSRPIFTLKQMTLICERMCEERTDQVRDEYDKILQQKLGEQYDAFVKFIDHQIQQRFTQASVPSYLS